METKKVIMKRWNRRIMIMISKDTII